MDNFPANSKNPVGAKAEKAAKKVEKVVSGNVVQKKKGFGSKFKDVFLGGDFNSATRYIAAEVLLPALRNMIVDATSKGVERMIYGDQMARRAGMQGRSRMSYNSISSRPDRPYLPGQARSVARQRASDDIILVSREEAELVVERICDLIAEFHVASVSDLNALLGLQSTYVDEQWGWTDQRFINVRQVREGWLVDMPPVEPI